MNGMKLAIIFQLSGAMNAFAGLLFLLFSFSDSWLRGVLLILIGAAFLVGGRLLLRRSRRSLFSMPSAYYQNLLRVEQGLGQEMG